MAMSRKEILDTYKVVDGRIQSPGKFEGEMLYVPSYWDAGLEGLADEDDGKTYVFELSAVDKKEFPELGGKRKLKLVESDSGFVYEV
jgi:hypothetical protein